MNLPFRGLKMKKKQSFLTRLLLFLYVNIQTVLLIIGIAVFSTGFFLLNAKIGFIVLGLILIILAVYVDHQSGGDD